MFVRIYRYASLVTRIPVGHFDGDCYLDVVFRFGFRRVRFIRDIRIIRLVRVVGYIRRVGDFQRDLYLVGAATFTTTRFKLNGKVFECLVVRRIAVHIQHQVER